MVEELVGGVVQRTYTYGHDLISQNRLNGGSWQASYHLADGLGSVRTLTDSSGSATDSYTYEAFGSVIASSGSTPNRYRFTGEQFAGDLGLYYLRARYYNQANGRFLSRDSYPIDLVNPREWNRYSYVAGNPVNFIDPSGYVGFEYGRITTTVQNVTRSAVVLGHRAGAAIAAAKGAFDALDARFITWQIRAQIAIEQGFVGRAMNNLTVAQTTVLNDATGEAKVVVAINSAKRSEPVLRAIATVINSLKARGIDAFVADGDLHAEQAVYYRALTYTKDFISIGISNTTGPCRDGTNCTAFFDDLKITVFYLGRLLLEKGAS